MLRAHRLRAFRLCLLILSVVLSSATVALGSSLPGVSVYALLAPPVSKWGTKHHRKSSASRRVRCAAVARAGKRKARKACAGKKPTTGAAKPNVSPKPAGTTSPSVAPSGTTAPVSGGPPPAEVLTVEPVEPTTPSEPIPPVEESKPPVEEPKPPVEEEKAKEPFRFFSPTSFWNEMVPASAPVDPGSAAMVSSFDGEIAAAEAAKKGLPNINTTAWSVPVYTVPARQATVKVTHELSYGEKPNVALQSAWDAVPLPPEAKPAAGTDRDLVVWQPSTNHLWEFWGLEKTGGGWVAKWGGAMDSASTDPGVYGPEAWPGAQTGWGVSATSMSVAGGLITLEDLEKGQINHAIAIAIPNARSGVYASPAQRTDGYSTSPQSLPEGAHLRLDPNLDLASLHLPHMTLMLAEAAQRYGIFVRDSSVNVTFVAQDPTPTATNPYIGAHGYFEGKSPQQLLASFPWKYLEVLKMELH